MVLILPSKRKFYNSLKEKFEINNIISNEDDIEDITTNLLNNSKYENTCGVLYFLWNDVGLMQRVSPGLHNIHSMKVSIGNFLRTHGGIDNTQTNTIITFQHWNQLLTSLQLLFTNSEFKWSKRERDKEDCCELFIISKSYDEYDPIIIRQPYLFNVTLNDNDPLFSITSNTTSSSSKIIDYIIGHSVNNNNNNNNNNNTSGDNKNDNNNNNKHNNNNTKHHTIFKHHPISSSTTESNKPHPPNQ